MAATLVLIDASTLFRQGLRHLLPENDFVVVAEGEAIDAPLLPERPEQADLVLFDVPDDMDAGTATERLRSEHPGARLVILAARFDAMKVRAAVEAGIDGLISKDRGRDTLIQGLRLVLLGERLYPADIMPLLTPGTTADTPVESRSGLSRRELEILERLMRGHSNKMIAIELGITEATMKVHLKSLLRKLGCNNRTQAAVWAMDRKLFDRAAA